MPKNNRLKSTHRASPYEKPVKTIEGSLLTLEGDEIDDSELKDLMSRLGELNRSEQRRLMVRYRKYIDKQNKHTKKHSPAVTVQQIGKRFPGVQSLLVNSNSKKTNHSQNKNVQNDSNESPVIITTKKQSSKTNTVKPDTLTRKSARLSEQQLHMKTDPKPDSEVVYNGNSNKKRTTNNRIQNDRTQNDRTQNDRTQNDLQLTSSSSFDLDHDNENLPGFVVSDSEDDSGETLGSVDSYTDEYNNDYRNNYRDNGIDIGLDEEINELLDDVPITSSKKRKRELDGMKGEERQKLHATLREIRENMKVQEVDIAKVITSGFNSEDNAWFYSRLNRLNDMEGKEKYDLEDQIQRKFTTLTSLKTSGLYEKFNKPAERNIIKEILDSDKPDEMKQIMINRMMSVSEDGGEEYQKAMSWLDVVMSIPNTCKNVIGSRSGDKNNSVDADFGSILFQLKQKLDSNLFGMENVKRQIMQAVTTIYNDPDSQGYIIALVGEPGVGKTTISSLIAETIGMGFGQIPCGSISSRSVVVGHASTYIGSCPGIFTQMLIRTGQLNNVVLLDELDKLPDMSLLPTLLQILDREQNFRFKDAFCPEIDIDMSKNLYIIAVNDISCFDKALRDRMKIINVKGYDTDQKTQICYNHIIPKIQAKTGITPNIDRPTIRYFVNKISPAISGVRDITRYFEDIYEKLQLIHRFTEYLKHNPQSLGVALEALETENSPKRVRIKRHPKKTSRPSKTTSILEDPSSPAAKFRDILKTQLNFDVPSNVDLRNVNSIKLLSMDLIESLEC